MNHTQKLFYPIHQTTLNTLYTLSEKSLITAIIFTIITTIALYSELGSNILLWGSMVILLSLLRLYTSYLFKAHSRMFNTKTWYILFVVFAFLTGITVSALGFWFVPLLNDYYQLFVLSALLGLTAGATISLSSDFRIAILYISIIILPLVVSLAMQDTPLNIIVPLMLILFFFSQIIMIFKSYVQEKKIRDLKEINQDLLDENKQFIADMVHQIKTPLTVIMANTSLIEMKSNEPISSNIGQINSAIGMLNNAYEDLSYIISHDTIVYKSIEINFTQFMNDRIDFFRSIIEDNHKTIEATIVNDISIVMNDTELERLIDNNITNAIKHSNDNSEIKIILEKNTSNILLQFISEGKAIKNISKIFEKNYTENHSAKRSLGLGLHMVKSICEKNSIEYRIHSEEGINTFTYSFEI